MLTVTSSASDLTLLTTAELRAAAGVTDSSKDAALAKLNARISSSIVSGCSVARAGTTPPTLRQEALQETFRQTRQVTSLILARRPIVSVTSVTVDDTALETDEYEFEAAAGLLYRLSGTCRICWRGVIVVDYEAGWATVPYDLKLAAEKYIQAITTKGGRDPMMRSKTIEGVSSTEWWVDPTVDSAIPAEVMDLLERGGYVETRVG